MRLSRLATLVVLGSLAVLIGTTSASAAEPRSGGSRASSTTIVAPTVVISPDPQRDLYVGTGGLVVPASNWRGPDAGRSEAAACTDCEWRVTVLCTKTEAAAGQCRTVHVGCPVGTTPVRIWLRHPGQDWAVVGETCQGPTPPSTLADVGRAIRDRAEAALPPLLAGAEPADGGLVGVPVLFRTGQPATGIRGADLSVLGLAVRLDARVRWHWTYGDGSQTWTSTPGGRWPDLSVSHTYRTAVHTTATVVSVWRGQYVVEGLGPFAVPAPLLTQQQQVAVVVRAAHAHLVG